MSSILVTGGLGFIGYNFIKKYSSMFPWKHIDVIDKISPQSLSPQMLPSNIDFHQIDLSNKHDVERIPIYRYSEIYNFAAESHVDRSIFSPEEFLRSNIDGTFFLLEKILKENQYARFHHISTDEVYGSVAYPSSENSPYNPSSMYSATKASSDMIVMAYNKTYGLRTSISNCCNNYGPYQNKEKMIPKYIDCLKNQLPYPVYGNGLNIREWIHVDDHNDAILQSMNYNLQKYNIGTGELYRNIDVLKEIYYAFNDTNEGFENTIMFVPDRAGHDLMYNLDSSLISHNVGWSPKIKFKDGIKKLVTEIKNDKIKESF